MNLFQKETVLGRSSAFVQILSLLLIIVLSLLFIYLFALLLAFPFWGKDVLQLINGEGVDFNQPGFVSFLKYLQVVSQIALFIVPPVIFAFLVHRKVFDYLKLNTGFTFPQLLISVVLIFVSLPFFSWLGLLNQQMVLPEFLSGVENWMKNNEEIIAQQLTVFLDVNTLGAVLFNFLMIAVIPGIGEELLFRGVLIRLFDKWLGNVHFAVILSSLLFSTLHLQFYGFLPRFALGVVLGYTFVWTSSLWIPILLHFLNNASILLFYYLIEKPDMTGHDIESFGSSDSFVIILASAFISFFLLSLLYKHKTQKN